MSDPKSKTDKGAQAASGLLSTDTITINKKLAFLGGAAVLALVAFSAFNVVGSLSSPNYEAMNEAFPNTKFDRFYKDETGLVAAESGAGIVYFTKDGRYVIAGNVIDLEERVDLTERRKQDLAAVGSLETKLFGEGGPATGRPAPSAGPSAAAAPAPSTPTAPSLTQEAIDLPEANFVVHNKGGSKILYVVSDYSCSFCKRLHAELEGLDVEVREIPVAYLGQQSGIKAASALCSDDPAKAADGYYNGSGGTQISTCSTGEDIVTQNTEWAQSRGITGTPFLIDVEGKANNGYLPQGRLKAFLGITS